MRGTNPRPFRCEAVLGGLWEFAICIACIVMAIVILGSEKEGKPAHCRGYYHEPGDCTEFQNLPVWKLRDIGGILLIPNGVLHFIMIFVGCVPLGLIPAYGDLVDEDEAEPLRTDLPAPVVVSGVAKPKATYLRSR